MSGEPNYDDHTDDGDSDDDDDIANRTLRCGSVWRTWPLYCCLCIATLLFLKTSDMQ